MTPAEHQFAPEDVMAYVDGDLQPAHEAQVRAHLAECPSCQAIAADVRGVSRDLERWTVEDAPATLAAARVKVPASHPIDRLKSWLWRPSSQLGLGAVAVALFAVGLTLGRPSGVQRMEAFPQPPVGTAAPSRIPDDYAGSSLPPASEADAALQMRVSRSESAAAVAPRSGAPGQLSALPSTAPAIARTARLRLRTADFDKVRGDVDRLMAELKGWYKEVSLSGSGQDNRKLTATMQVPSAQLDEALRRLKTLGTVDSEVLSGEDVGEQIVDVEARLSNARKTETRLLDLLQRRTGDVEQVLAAEREVARVREEIERFVARRKSLGDRVTYAALTLEVAESRQATVNLGPEPIGGRVRDAFVTGVGEAVDTAVGLTLLVIRVAPTLLLWSLLLILPIRLAIRWSRKRSAVESTSSAT
jgi:anti-sigma factor RsiW